MFELEQDELEMHPLHAAQYRRLWLDEAHTLGLVAETLAEVLGWQPTADDPLPDALELAAVAAEKIVELEGLLVGADIHHRSPRNPSSKTRARRTPTFVLN